MKKITKIFASILCVCMLTGAVSTNVAFANGGDKTSTTTSSKPSMDDIEIKDGKLELGAYEKDDKDKGQILNRVLTEYKGIVTFITGIALVSMIMFFVLNLIALGNSKGNPQERQKAVTGLIVSGIATAGLGAVNIIVALFYNMITEEGN